MKRNYVVFLMTFSLLWLLGRIDTVQAANVVMSRLGNQTATLVKEKTLTDAFGETRGMEVEPVGYYSKSTLGKTVYGFCIADDNWSAESGPQYGLYSFNTNSPGEITKVWSTDMSIDAGAYYDGYYYVQTSVMEGNTYTSMKFGRFEAETGVYEEIADWTASKPRFTDLTVDYSSESPQLIGLQYGLTATKRKMVKIDMNTGAFTTIISGNTSGTFAAIACSYDGTIYVVNTAGKLQKINRTTGNTINVGTVSTGISSKNLQSMEFDHTDGKLYWASYSSAEISNFGVINTETGVFTPVGVLGNNSELTGLYVPFVVGVPGTPGKITGLSIEPSANGAKSAIIKWKNPVKDNTGTVLTSKFSINVYRNGEIVNTIQNQMSGNECSYTDNVPSSATYTYKVTAINEFGESMATIAKSFVGEDVPKGPTNVILTSSGNSAVLNWTAPSIGGNNGWINSSQLKYKIIRNPGAIVVTENATGTSFTDNSITQLAYYSYSVQARTTAGDGGVTMSNSLNIGPALLPPYSCNFSADQFPMWTVIDANEDFSTWTGNGSAIYNSYGINDADDWLISPPLNLAEGKYRLSFDYSAKNMSNPEQFKVFFGQGATIEAQTNELANCTNVINMLSLSKTLIVDVAQAGIYNFSFYVYSVANYYGLTISNFKLEKMGDKDLSALSVAGTTLPMVGKEYTYDVTIYNSGTLTQNIYSVQLVDEEGVVLASTDVVPEIPMNNTRVVAVNWTPENEGMMPIRGKVVLSGDVIADNDISTAITVDVQPAGGDQMVLIGEGNEESVNMPINFYYKSSVSQTIYLSSEIDMENGLIKKIIYPYRNGSFRDKEFVKNIKVYMANTDLSTTANGWIPQDQLSLVFDGNITLVADGEGQMIITLDTPFVYTGGNVCIMMSHPMDVEFVNGIYFYLTTNDDSRVRHYHNDQTEFDWTQEGTTSNKIPRIILQIAELGAAKIVGNVKCDGVPLEGVKITISPVGMVALTDAEGNYEFDEVPADTYSMTAVKHGYADGKAIGVVVSEHLTTTRNILMNKLYKFSVSGTVKDVDGVGIEGASVEISGYDNYMAITDAIGNFTVVDVYSAQQYALKIKKKGYEIYNTTFDVSSEVSIPTVNMIAVAKIAERVTANATAQKVDLTWNAPSETTFRYDDGAAIGGLNPVYPPSPFGVMGTVHRTPTILNSMSWWTVDDPFMGAPHAKVNVFVFDLDENGEPSHTILFNCMDVPNKDGQWTSFTFPTPIECPRGFMVAISYAGIMGLGHDSGSSAEWPYVPSGSYSCPHYVDKPFTRMNGDMAYNLMVRAEGNEIMDDKELSGDLVKGYKVFRLAEEDVNFENKWVALTPSPVNELSFIDNSWSSVENGTYKYAVKTVYAGDLLSAPAFSNMVAKGMETTVTVNVTTNTTPNDSNEARITLTNNDNDPLHVYTGTVDANGKSIIQNVWRGVYKVSIEKDGYNSFEVSDVEIKIDNVSLSYVLEETVVVPFNLEIVENEYPSERIFNWNVPSSKVLKRYEVYLNDEKKGDVTNTTYLFTALENGSYIAGVKAVYGSTTTEMVTIPFEVTGQVVAAPVRGKVIDIESLPVSDVNVKITGKRTYSTTTDATGAFNFDAIMSGNGYTVTLSKDGYDNYSKTFSVTAGVELNFGDILLSEKTYIPRKIKATEDDNNMKISWINGADAQLKVFRNDDGNAINGLGSPNGDDKSVVGTVFRTAASLTEMSWVTVGNATKVNVFVFDLTDGGEPTNTIIYSELNVTNKPSSSSMVWNRLVFPAELDCPRGFYLALSIAKPSVGNIALGFDSGTSSTWPFVPNVSYYNGDYTDISTLQYVGNQFPGNLMIRAEGYEKNRFNEFNNSKSLTGYKVWRLLESDQTDESKWTLLTQNMVTDLSINDDSWSGLGLGTYKYAVKAVYTGGTISSPGFSNPVSRTDMFSVLITQASHGTIEVKNGSTLISSGDKLLNNSELTIIATPESDDYVLDKITVNGVAITGNKYKLTENVFISAVFRPDVSVDDIEQSMLNLYPNPVKDVLTIEGSFSLLEIYDQTGRLVLRSNSNQISLQDNVNKIDMSSFVSGTYIIKVLNAEGYKSYKITKQ